jgi:hypothetical protein
MDEELFLLMLNCLMAKYDFYPMTEVEDGER